jgi:presequence protease
MTPYSLHGGDPLDLFRINEFSNKIREDFNKGDLFESLIEKHLLNNRHYLQLLYTADPKKADREEHVEKQHLTALEKALSREDKQHIVQEA